MSLADQIKQVREILGNYEEIAREVEMIRAEREPGCKSSGGGSGGGGGPGRPTERGAFALMDPVRVIRLHGGLVVQYPERWLDRVKQLQQMGLEELDRAILETRILKLKNPFCSMQHFSGVRGIREREGVLVGFLVALGNKKRKSD